MIPNAPPQRFFIEAERLPPHPQSANYTIPQRRRRSHSRERVETKRTKKIIKNDDLPVVRQSGRRRSFSLLRARFSPVIWRFLRWDCRRPSL